MGSPNEAAEPGSIDPPASDSDQYCLRWTNHGSHVLAVFRQLLCDEALVDVTLAAEGQSLRAHKMVLSACSSFFRTIFVSHPERHPIIILKDTKFAELKTLLEFMYRGEVSVEYGQLGTLLKTAENLRVKGLTEVSTNDPAATTSSHKATEQPPHTTNHTPTGPNHHHSLHRCSAQQPPTPTPFPLPPPPLQNSDDPAEDLEADANPLLFDERLALDPHFVPDEGEPTDHLNSSNNPLPSAATGLPSSHQPWSRARERDRLLHPHHYHPYNRNNLATSDSSSANHHGYRDRDWDRDRHSQTDPARNQFHQQQQRHSPHYTLDHRERERDLRDSTASYSPNLVHRSSHSHSHSNSSPLLVKRDLRHPGGGAGSREREAAAADKEIERFSPGADHLPSHPSPATPPLATPSAEAAALIVVERFSPSDPLLHPSATSNASTGPLDASQTVATSLGRGLSKPASAASSPSPRVRPNNNHPAAAKGRPRTPKQEAEDLRVSSASPPQTPSNTGVNFRASADAGGSSGPRRFNTWPSLQSESSDTESEDYPMASPSGSRNPSRGPPYMPSSASGMGPPQHIPLSLKKEQEWEGGEGLPSGGTRPDGPPSRSRSRSPTFSESSSEYGRHADQEVQVGGSGGYSGPGTVVDTIGSSTATSTQPSTSRVPPPPPPAAGGGVFPCGRCGVAFPSPSRLSRHMLSHNLEAERERDFSIAAAAGTIFPRDNSEMMQRHSLSIKRRHMTGVLDHAAAAAGLYGRSAAHAATATIASLAVEERFYEFGRLRTRHGSYGGEDSSTLSRNRSAAFKEDGGRATAIANYGSLGEGDPNERESLEASGHRRDHVRGLSSMFSHGMDGSALGSIPSVAMLASLMGEGHNAGDLPLGPVMFPRLGQDGQLACTVSTASMVHSMSSLGLSMGLPAGTLNLGPAPAPPSHHPHSHPSGSTSSGSGSAAAALRGSASAAAASAGTPALCKFCGKSFLELGALMAHLPFHTGERPFRCDFCGKAFKLRHHMKDHARVHTGERPFPCRLCGKTFSRSTILKAHEKTHLPKSERGFLQPPSPPDGLGSGPLPP